MTPSGGGVGWGGVMETASQEENDVHLSASAYTHGCAGLPSDVRG